MNYLLTFTLLAYLIGMVQYILYLALRRNLLFTIATVSIAVGFCSHTGILFMRSAITGHGPYTNSFEYCTFFSWCIVLTYLIAEVKFKIRDLGSFIIPVAFFLLVAAFYLPVDDSLIRTPMRFWLTIHSTFSFLGYSALALTFGAGIMFLLQDRQLKAKHIGFVYHRLPSLETLDNANRIAIDIGFPLITIGMVSGFIWTWQKYAAFFVNIEGTLLIILTWLIYAVIFFGRITSGWRGKRAAHFGVAGFVIVILGYILHIS